MLKALKENYKRILCVYLAIVFLAFVIIMPFAYVEQQYAEADLWLASCCAGVNNQKACEHMIKACREEILAEGLFATLLTVTIVGIAWVPRFVRQISEYRGHIAQCKELMS